MGSQRYLEFLRSKQKLWLSEGMLEGHRLAELLQGSFLGMG